MASLDQVCLHRLKWVHPPSPLRCIGRIGARRPIAATNSNGPESSSEYETVYETETEAGTQQQQVQQQHVKGVEKPSEEASKAKASLQALII